MSLEVRNLNFGYRCWKVLKGVSFYAEQGNLIFLLGKNGSGKSTLFRCILGLLNQFNGVVLINRKNAKSMTYQQLAKSIAYIPQNHSTAFGFSVLDMVLMGTTSQLRQFAVPNRKQREFAADALKMLGIEHLSFRSYAHISGGEQQLVLIARAIAQQAKILIMDEPCANLDYGNQIRVMEEIKKLAGQGYLIILSTHNPEHALLFANQVIVLADGIIKCFGQPDEVLDEKLLEEIYGVKVNFYEIVQNGVRVCLPATCERRIDYVESI